MFIKVFVPNSRGKIELTVEELEELLSDACEKAVREKCASCNRNYWGSVTYLNSGNEKTQDWSKVTCSNHDNAIDLNGGVTIADNVDSTFGTTTYASTLSANIKKLIGE